MAYQESEASWASYKAKIVPLFLFGKDNNWRHLLHQSQKQFVIKGLCTVCAMAHPSHFSGAKTLFNLLTFLGIFDPDTNSPANFVTRFAIFINKICFTLFAPDMIKNTSMSDSCLFNLYFWCLMKSGLPLVHSPVLSVALPSQVLTQMINQKSIICCPNYMKCAQNGGRGLLCKPGKSKITHVPDLWEES